MTWCFCLVSAFILLTVFSEYINIYIYIYITHLHKITRLRNAEQYGWNGKLWKLLYYHGALCLFNDDPYLKLFIPMVHLYEYIDIKILIHIYIYTGRNTMHIYNRIRCNSYMRQIKFIIFTINIPLQLTLPRNTEGKSCSLNIIKLHLAAGPLKGFTLQSFA